MAHHKAEQGVQDFVEQVKEDLLCSYCKDVLSLPQTLFGGCGHTFCLICVSKVVEDKDTPSCPTCGCPILKNHLGPNRPLSSLIRKLQPYLPPPNEDIASEALQDESKMPSALNAGGGEGSGAQNAPTEGPPTYDEAWLKTFVDSSQPSEEDCTHIEAELRKLEKILALGNTFLKADLPNRNENVANTHLEVGPAPHDSPQTLHRTAEIDAALKAFGFDVGGSVSPPTQHGTQEAVPVHSNHVGNFDRKINNEGQQSQPLDAVDEDLRRSGSSSDLDPLAEAHRKWTQDDTAVDTTSVIQDNISLGIPAGKSNKSSRPVKEPQTDVPSSVPVRTRVRVKDKRCVHATVAQTIDMGIPPSETSKPRRGRKRRSIGERAGSKRKAPGISKTHTPSKMRTKRQQTTPDTQEMDPNVVDIDKIEDLENSTPVKPFPGNPSTPSVPVVVPVRGRSHRNRATQQEGKPKDVTKEADSKKPASVETGAKVAEATEVLAEPEESQPTQEGRAGRGRAQKRQTKMKAKEKKKAGGRKRSGRSISTSQKARKRCRKEMVEKKVDVFWDGMEAWYRGKIVEFREKRGDFKVDYDDGEVHWERLPLQKEGVTWCFVNQPDTDLPTPPHPQEAVTAVPAPPPTPVMPKKVLAVTDMKASQRKQTLLSCQEYGGELREEVTEETTHLVVGGYEGNKVTKRTAKVMRAMMCNTPIITFEWIKECESQGRWVDETPFLVQGYMNLVWEAGNQDTTNLFKDTKIIIENQYVPEDVSMGYLLMDLIEYGGGQLITELPKNFDGEQILTVSWMLPCDSRPETDPTGDKLRVSHIWVYDSVMSKHRMPLEPYILDADPMLDALDFGAAMPFE